MADIERYLCGCRVCPDGHPTACPLHGRIVEHKPVTEPVPTYPVLFTREELVALGQWLRRQTFPYDDAAVHSAASRVTAVTEVD